MWHKQRLLAHTNAELSGKATSAEGQKGLGIVPRGNILFILILHIVIIFLKHPFRVIEGIDNADSRQGFRGAHKRRRRTDPREADSRSIGLTRVLFLHGIGPFSYRILRYKSRPMRKNKQTKKCPHEYCKGLNNRGGQKGGYTGYYIYAWS